MTIVLDHTIVPVRDMEESVEFYTGIFGFTDLGAVGPFLFGVFHRALPKGFAVEPIDAE